jgi:predicted alpha/beta-hydrolase family hydrolase
MAARLAAEGISSIGVQYARKKPTEPYAQELEDVRRTRDGLSAERLVLVGRSFGGRMCARIAAQEPPAALILLGHPIAPEGGKPRPDDEAALLAVRCPTFIVQGDHDRLGPLSVLQRIAKSNSNIEIYVLEGAGHSFGQRQAEGLEHAAGWLKRVLRL